MNTFENKPAEPVTVSGEATQVLASKMREWSGWPNARLVLDCPSVSPFAETEHTTRTFTICPDTLVLNPNRVLLSITPFRLRQEAVLTGAMLHEAAHARHTHWKPRTIEQIAEFNHGDGTPVSRQAFALASLMEEPRIEGIMAAQADYVGARGLGWTLRASAAYTIPSTNLHLTDTDQQIMDLISSWTLRAGRQYALAAHTSYTLPSWVHDFNALLMDTVKAHLDDDLGAAHVFGLLVAMIRAGAAADTGTFMVDKARDVLAILFPETDGDSPDAPMPSGSSCGEGEGEGEGEGDGEGGSSGQPEDQPEDEQSADESAEQGSGGAEAGDETEEPGDSDSGAEAGQPEDESDDGSGSGGGNEDSDSDSDGGGDEDEDEDEVTDGTVLAAMLAALEEEAKSEVEDEAEAEAEATPSSESGSGAGSGEGGAYLDNGFRAPTSTERGVAKNAETFLRHLINPTESSKVSLSESPSSSIDGAALSAWKAGGQSRDPMFFRRTQRQVEPSPPVNIAVLVDISISMAELQKPSSLLSWALASAALDMRNYAGRGAQVHSTLIHWGDEVHVIQRDGQVLPGIREVECNELTTAVGRAHDEVAVQLPGFFDLPERPVNRLLVHFTDWELHASCRRRTGEQIKQALANGVNVLSVVPRAYSVRNSALPDILANCDVQRGSHTLMKYDPDHPEQVWDEAAKALA